MSNNRPIVTGRGGVGNVRAPLKLELTSISHPQTASILARHEAENLEYERQVLKRNKEIKANTRRVSGRGGIGNITETNPKSPTKSLRRVSLFRGGGAGVSTISTPSNILDMNVYDEEERRSYAHNKNRWRQSDRPSTASLNGPGSGGNSPLSPDSEYSGSDKASACSISIRSMSTSNFSIQEDSTTPPSSPSKEKTAISVLWSRVVRSNSRSRPPPRQKSQDLLAIAELATSSNPRPFDDYDDNYYGTDLFPDFAGDPSEPVAVAL